MTRSLQRLATVLFLTLALVIGGAAPVSAGAGTDVQQVAASARECVPSPQPDIRSLRSAVDLLAAASMDGRQTAIVSPLSVETVLAMASYGANAELRDAVRRLFVEETGAWRPVCRLAAVLNATETDDGVDLNIANGAFSSLKLDVLPAFRAALEDRFGAKVAPLDFSQRQSTETINS